MIKRIFLLLTILVISTVSVTPQNRKFGGGATSPVTLTASTAAEVPLRINLAASQSANAFSIFNSSNVFYAGFTSSGALSVRKLISFSDYGDMSLGNYFEDGRFVFNYNGSTSIQFRNNSAEIDFQVNRTTTAGQTRMMVWDVDNGTLERVTVGAADSCGTGFKCLRIPN